MTISCLWSTQGSGGWLSGWLACPWRMTALLGLPLPLASRPTRLAQFGGVGPAPARPPVAAIGAHGPLGFLLVHHTRQQIRAELLRAGASHSATACLLLQWLTLTRHHNTQPIVCKQSSSHSTRVDFGQFHRVLHFYTFNIHYGLTIQTDTTVMLWSTYTMALPNISYIC